MANVGCSKVDDGYMKSCLPAKIGCWWPSSIGNQCRLAPPDPDLNIFAVGSHVDKEIADLDIATGKGHFSLEAQTALRPYSLCQEHCCPGLQLDQARRLQGDDDIIGIDGKELELLEEIWDWTVPHLLDNLFLPLSRRIVNWHTHFCFYSQWDMIQCKLRSMSSEMICARNFHRRECTGGWSDREALEIGEGTHPSEPLPVNQQASALNVGATEGSSGNNRPHFSVASKSLTDGSSYKRKNSGTNDQTDPGVKKLRVDEGGEADIQQPGLLRRTLGTWVNKALLNKGYRFTSSATHIADGAPGSAMRLTGQSMTSQPPVLLASRPASAASGSVTGGPVDSGAVTTSGRPLVRLPNRSKSAVPNTTNSPCIVGWQASAGAIQAIASTSLTGSTSAGGSLFHALFGAQQPLCPRVPPSPVLAMTKPWLGNSDIFWQYQIKTSNFSDMQLNINNKFGAVQQEVRSMCEAIMTIQQIPPPTSLPSTRPRVHAWLFSHIKSNAMSSDKSEGEDGTDNQPKKHTSKTPSWRSKEYMGFLWHLDDIIAAQRVPKVGHRCIRGSAPRHQYHPEPDNFNTSAPAPLGLPKNCYDRAWV
ncbi:hypothetical protein PAXINDRAFT_152827 [Paxillus involutus ATCC 200175]|nr:hypothetical protein PAXINDRAFT_152827 [Paxillus involutus ATCC 200175]